MKTLEQLMELSSKIEVAAINKEYHTTTGTIHALDEARAALQVALVEAIAGDGVCGWDGK